jgi:hypothetical protein
MSKHTPGPWRVTAKINTNIIRQARQDDGFDDYIASTWGGPHEANARLIAAAPDLLAALIAALEDIEEYRIDANCTPSSIELVIAAIAKATGSAS